MLLNYTYAATNDVINICYNCFIKYLAFIIELITCTKRAFEFFSVKTGAEKPGERVRYGGKDACETVNYKVPR